jgi:hypothetical protein
MSTGFDNMFDQEIPEGALEFTDIKVLGESDKAWHVRFPNNPKSKWVPKSRCQLSKDTLYVPEWLVGKWKDEDFDPENAAPEEMVAIENCLCLKETEAALWVQMPDGQRLWWPKSQILGMSEVQGDADQGTLVVTAYIAGEKGYGEKTKQDGSPTSPTRTAMDDIMGDSRD